jgi:arginine decarboxylase
MLPINNWDAPYTKVNLGGLTCDSADYYNTESHSEDLYMPMLDDKNPDEEQFIGFFHTGAYQESLGGYGGIQHCLIPAPKHVLIDLDENGNLTTELFAKEQGAESMMKILGYRSDRKKAEPLIVQDENINFQKEKEN